MGENGEKTKIRTLKIIRIFKGGQREKTIWKKLKSHHRDGRESTKSCVLQTKETEWLEGKRGYYFQDIKQSNWQEFLEPKSG